MSRQPLPFALQRRSDRDAIFEDIEPYLETTIAERDEILTKLCRFASEQISSHPKQNEIWAFQEPLPLSSKTLWQTLIAKARSDH